MPSSSSQKTQDVKQRRRTRAQVATIVASEDNSQSIQTVRKVLCQPDGTGTEQTLPISSRVSTLLTNNGQGIQLSEENQLQMISAILEQAAAGGLADENNQVILNVGNAYQTVTVVPTNGNSGEVSYMFIVSQSDDDKDPSNDFNEDETYGEIFSEEVAADGKETIAIRVMQKKSQLVTQAHKCNYCNYTSSKRHLLSQHLKSHSEKRPHKCGVCGKGFKTRVTLQNHVNTHTGIRPYSCRDCNSSFTTSGELTRHVRYRHTHEKPHHCTECDYACVELARLRSHMRIHTGEKPYQCLHCTYASSDKFKLKRHLRVHTGEKPYECDICQARFTQSNSLKSHKFIHSGKRPSFHCDFCPSISGRKADLQIHMRNLHTSDKLLKCKRCGKIFPDRYSYKLHSKTHVGEKCFKCNFCPYASIWQGNLKLHMLTHMDEKPFPCDKCDQAFRQKQLLKRHKNLHHDPSYVAPPPKEKTNECSECGKAFRHKGNLINHLAVHHSKALGTEKEEALRIGELTGPGEQPDRKEEEYCVKEEEDDVEVSEFHVTVTCSEQGTVQGTEDGKQMMIKDEDQDDDQQHSEGDDMHAGINGENVQLARLQDDAEEDCFARAVAEAIGEVPPSPTSTARCRDRPKKQQGKKQQDLKAAFIKDNSNVSTAELTLQPSTTCEQETEPSNPRANMGNLDYKLAELQRRRLEQKQKDLDECFGFNDDEEET